MPQALLEPRSIRKTTLSIHPDRWFSVNYQVFHHHQPIAQLRFSRWGEAGELDLLSAQYRIYREASRSSNFLLETEGKCLAYAEKLNPLYRAFFIQYGDCQYELKATSATGRRFILQEYGEIIGSIRPKYPLSPSAIGQLPETLPLSVRLFLVWLVLMFWRRESLLDFRP